MVDTMHERLSKRSEKVIQSLANEIAREYQQEYVGTEHVLLAILAEGTGVGAKVFEQRGYDLATVKAKVDQCIKNSLEETWVFGRLPGSPHFRNVLARAIEEARSLEAKEVCTEHLLLGLLKESGSVAGNVLQGLKMGYTDVRADVLKLYEARTGS